MVDQGLGNHCGSFACRYAWLSMHLNGPSFQFDSEWYHDQARFERVVGRNFSPNSEEMRHWRFRLFEVIFGLVKVAAYYDLSRGRGAGLAAGGGAGVAARDGAEGA